MAKLSDLGLTNEQVGQPIDYAAIPDQMGSFTPPPQPGPYRFKLPMNLGDCWEVFDHPNGQPPGKRIMARFDENHPLTIIQSPNNERNGEPFQTSLSNAERKRGKKDDATAPYVSDMDYVFRDVFKLPGKPATNAAYVQEFQKHAGAEFGANVEWSWKCNDQKNIFVDNGQGGLQEMEQKGCGTKYYQKDVPKVLSNPEDPNSPQVFPLRITCVNCGANVRAFANLTNYRE